jgi:molybdopterin-binding protein
MESMSQGKRLITAREASKMLGIAYPTIKTWILKGRLKTVLTPGGHHRVPLSSLRPFLEPDFDAEARGKSQVRLSARNQAIGEVISVRAEGFMAQVVVEVWGLAVMAVVPAEAVEQLQAGDHVAISIKATDVMVAKD